MELDALEAEAQSSIAAASTVPELEDVRVRILGRKADLPQALRAVRDRETGMALNAVRQRLESAFAERRAAIEEEELERRLNEETIDVTLPGERLPLGHLHPITQVRRAVVSQQWFVVIPQTAIEPIPRSRSHGSSGGSP